jgi:protein-tyrosine phosphatase
MVRVCFVCLGNICRSPTAEGVMRHLVERAGLDHAVEIDSAGTDAYHAGEAPDRRAHAAARARGIRLEGRARRFERVDWDRFDYVLAMDSSNHRELERRAPTPAARAKLRLFRSFDPSAPPEASVPDPYYGGADGFEEVLDICERACGHLLSELTRTHGLAGRR